jgi:multiple sugar transport system substrate-binding protein
MMAVQMSRRTALGVGLGGLSAGLLSACSGASTTGASAGALSFLSTQFNPIEESHNFQGILTKRVPGTEIAFSSVDAATFATTVTSQLKAKKVQVSLLGGLHGDLATFTDQLADLDGLMGELSTARFPAQLAEVAKYGGTSTKYVPWMQASYVIAVNKKSLAWLPSGVDVHNLTYDGLLDWMTAAKKAAGRPVFGLPAGPMGLYHRFFQGYLLPSFTGGQVVPFRSADAVQAWTYMKQLWSVSVPASTNYSYMQEPLESGEVLVAWDHVTRLIDAPTKKPDDYIMVPAPRGPKGQGYMLVVAGLGILKDSPRQDDARKVIKALCTPAAQSDVLRKNGFFPTIGGSLPSALPPAIALESAAVTRQQKAPGAIGALPPVGVGTLDGQISQVFKDCFTLMCLDDKAVAATLNHQGDKLNALLEQTKAPCWAPDKPVSGEICQVA